MKHENLRLTIVCMILCVNCQYVDLGSVYMGEGGVFLWCKRQWVACAVSFLSIDAHVKLETQIML